MWVTTGKAQNEHKISADDLRQRVSDDGQRVLKHCVRCAMHVTADTFNNLLKRTACAHASTPEQRPALPASSIFSRRREI
jgi:hypothetical protein